MLQQGKDADKLQIETLRKTMDALQREKRAYEVRLQEQFNNKIDSAKQDYKGQVELLTKKIKEMSMAQTALQEEERDEARTKGYLV